MNKRPPNSSQQQQPSLIILVGGGFLIFCVLFAVYAELTGMSKSPSPDAAGNLTTMAFVQCQDIVKGELVSPSTADFPFMDFSANAAPDNLYIIKSYVDSQNGFGATIRTRWRCKARYIGGDKADPRSWKLVDLQMYKR